MPYVRWMGFGERLKDARKAKMLTGEQLGKALDVSKQTISHWENDRFEPSLTQLSKLCDVLAVSADHLVREAGLSSAAIEMAKAFDIEVGHHKPEPQKSLQTTLLGRSSRLGARRDKTAAKKKKR